MSSKTDWKNLKNYIAINKGTFESFESYMNRPPIGVVEIGGQQVDLTQKYVNNVVEEAKNNIKTDTKLIQDVEETWTHYDKWNFLNYSGEPNHLTIIYEYIHNNSDNDNHKTRLDMMEPGEALKWYVDIYGPNGVYSKIINVINADKARIIGERNFMIELIIWVIVAIIVSVSIFLIIPFLIVLAYVYYKRRNKWSFRKIWRVSIEWPARLRQIARL